MSRSTLEPDPLLQRALVLGLQMQNAESACDEQYQRILRHQDLVLDEAEELREGLLEIANAASRMRDLFRQAREHGKAEQDLRKQLDAKLTRMEADLFVTRGRRGE